MYGMFSGTIPNVLETIDVTTSRTIVNGNRSTRYHNLSNPDLTHAPVDFLEQIHTETKNITTADLATFSKNVPMFEKTAWKEIAEFTPETVDID